MFHYMHQWNIFVLKNKVKNMNVYYHLPGLFEFYEFYKKFRAYESMAHHLIVYGLVDASVMQIVIQKKYSL